MSDPHVPGTEVSRLVGRAAQAASPFLTFLATSAWSRHGHEPGACDFVVGNPHDMPVPALVEALARWTPPRTKDWYAYKTNEPGPRAVVADSLRRRRGLPFEPEDVFLTTGAFAGIAASLRALTDPGDEVLFVSPPWFFYESIIVAAGATPVSIKARPVTFDLDLEAIESRLGPKTRALIVNSPNNPTGRIYDGEQLRALGELLERASRRWGRRIYLLSDEAYSRIVYDGAPFVSPTGFYPHSLLIYTYGKQLLMPGERIGYVALPPTMPDRGPLRDALATAQMTTGFAFPNAILQAAIGDLDELSIDIAHYQARRDRVVSALRKIGYQVNSPQGTFYLLVKSPWPDDVAFTEHLAARELFVLPGTIVELPGSLRVSLTANDEMIERALPIFAEAFVVRAPEQTP